MKPGNVALATLAAGAVLFGGAAAAKTVEVDPSAPAWIHALAWAVLVLHIAGGAVGLVAGTAALVFRKGGKPHRLAGNIFFGAMLVMAGFGALAAPFLPERITTLAGFFTFYLVATGWIAVRRRVAGVKPIDIIAFVYALGCLAALAVLAVQVRASPDGMLDGVPGEGVVVFGALASIAVITDVKVLLNKGVAGVGRIARHIWRMCSGLFIAVTSFFLGQMQVFPEAVQTSGILFAPVLASLLIMLFWLVFIRISPRYRGRPAPRAA